METHKSKNETKTKGPMAFVHFNGVFFYSDCTCMNMVNIRKNVWLICSFTWTLTDDHCLTCYIIGKGLFLFLAGVGFILNLVWESDCWGPLDYNDRFQFIRVNICMLRVYNFCKYYTDAIAILRKWNETYWRGST